MGVHISKDVEIEVWVDLYCAKCNQPLQAEKENDSIKVQSCSCGGGNNENQSFPEFLTDRIRRGIFALEHPDKNSLICFIDEQYLIFKSL